MYNKIYNINDNVHYFLIRHIKEIRNFIYANKYIYKNKIFDNNKKINNINLQKIKWFY